MSDAISVVSYDISRDSFTIRGNWVMVQKQIYI